MSSLTKDFQRFQEIKLNFISSNDQQSIVIETDTVGNRKEERGKATINWSGNESVDSECLSHRQHRMMFC